MLHSSTTGAAQQATRLVAVAQQHNWAAREARNWPENVKSGTNGVGKPTSGPREGPEKAQEGSRKDAKIDLKKFRSTFRPEFKNVHF